MVDGIKVESFEQLTVWQESQLFAVAVYNLTKEFPKDETFAMTSQLRRAASSISANIAEGFGRSSVNDKLHFYTMAYSSLLDQSTSCQKLINASKKSLKL